MYVGTGLWSAVHAAALVLCLLAASACGDHVETATQRCQGGPGTVLSGMLDGEHLCHTYRGGVWAASPERDRVDVHFGTWGDLVLLGGIPTTYPSDTAVPVNGFLRMPTDGPSPGRLLCAGDASSYRGVGFELRGLSDLGTCAGEPVSGEIELCWGSDEALCPLGHSLRGSIEGVAFDWSGLSSDSAAGRAHDSDMAWVSVELPDGILVANFERATVVAGVLWNPPDEQPGRGAYCIGGGSAEGDILTSLRITATDLSWMGNCGDTPVDGSIDGWMSDG